MLKNYTISLIKIFCFLFLASCENDFKLNEHEEINIQNYVPIIAKNIEDNVNLGKEKHLKVVAQMNPQRILKIMTEN